MEASRFAGYAYCGEYQANKNQRDKIFGASIIGKNNGEGI